MNACGAPPDFESTFLAQYKRIAVVIARVVGDPARAEELAVDVFVKLWRNPQAQRGHTEAWLYRVAVRHGLDELRGRIRQKRRERLLDFIRPVPTPEDIRKVTEEQERVRMALLLIDPRAAELLVLRSHGLSYEELADSLNLKAASVGTLLSRAQQSFRKEYIKRYGNE